ncbi:serine hydrolase domain-containing protein [Novosphingobium sp. PhB165]|uniref:serine hydrolase domain-containing protein n=1 Tax=Novosphingobium sp. PhB165 TaxID=2485105 RepID=UPI001FB47815|nr:serine hydrolase domain-containing protein [Novosphingobium sp. PhB165]
MALRLGVAAGLGAGLGAALLPRLAWAVEQPVALPKVTALVDRWVGTGKFPGMVASLGLPGREAQFVARGAQGFDDGTAMGPDSLFRIYSMTKPVTGMMAMQLIEEGRLALDQPLADVLPAWRDMRVQDRYDGPLDRLHAAPRPITMRHLLTHTSGIGYSIVQTGPIRDAYVKQGLVPGQVSRIEVPGLTYGAPIHGLDHFADRLATLPLVADPGTRWSYSMGLDVMGRVIEVVTGKRFDAYLAEALFGPAGMTSTEFRVGPGDVRRLTTNYGALGGVLVPIDPPESSVYLDPPAFPFGGSGLVSSPRDYDRFLRLLAQGGMIDGRRVLSERAVALGTSDLLPPGVDRSHMIAGPSGFGAGGRVGQGAEAGIFGWSGAAGTVGMVDMTHGLRSQLFVQFMPSDALPLLPEFQTALKADVMALMETRP